MYKILSLVQIIMVHLADVDPKVCLNSFPNYVLRIIITFSTPGQTEG